MFIKKQYKRYFSIILSIAIGIESFFSAEIPSFAMNAEDSLESYVYEEQEATPSELTEDVVELPSEGISVEDLFNTSDEIYFDEEGIKLVPLSPDAIELLNVNEAYDDLNPPIQKKERMSTVLGAGFLAFCATILVYVGHSIFGISKTFCESVNQYLIYYAFPGHDRTFIDVDFTYNDSSGFPVTSKITQGMMNRYGEKISTLSSNDLRPSSLYLSDEDKLCLAYSLYMQNALVNISRSNIVSA